MLFEDAATVDTPGMCRVHMTDFFTDSFLDHPRPREWSARVPCALMDTLTLEKDVCYGQTVICKEVKYQPTGQG